MKRYEISDEKIKESINLQYSAKFRPERITIAKGWVPKNAYDHHLANLTARQ